MNKRILEALGFEEEVQNVELGLCPFCNQPIRVDEFKDELSIKEYKISGLCQRCQDGFFGEGGILGIPPESSTGFHYHHLPVP